MVTLDRRCMVPSTDCADGAQPCLAPKWGLIYDPGSEVTELLKEAYFWIN